MCFNLSRALFLAALGLMVAGCSQPSPTPDIGRLPVLTSDDPKAEAEVREANELAARGKRDLAAEKYRAFLHERPEDKLVPLVQLSLGRIYLQERRDGEALALFTSVSMHPEPAVAEQGRFYGAIASERLGRHNDAIEALEPMLGRTIEPADTLQLLKTLATAYEAEGRYFDAITTLEHMQAPNIPAAERDAAHARLNELVVHKASPADIRRVLDELDAQGPAYRLALIRAVKDADAAHDLDRTRELLALLAEHNIPLDEELAAISLRAAAPSDANPAAIGALVSLSGRARKVGEQALRGLMLAAGLPDEGPKPPNAPSVFFRDDAGNPARAVQAVNELVSTHRVIAIIGPLDSQVALAAGQRAQELGVPLITLTPAGTPSAIGDMVFRYFPTPQAEARALAQAAQARGARTFAVLYPETAYGQAMAAAFEQAAAEAGLSEGFSRSYAAGATSFGAEAAALDKSAFDALFVPDSAQELALIAPALAAAGLWTTPQRAQKGSNSDRTILLLAPSVAYDASLPRLAGRYLQGALFSVPFDAHEPEGAVPDFVQRFQAAFGSEPDMFAAFAYDAYRLARDTIDAGATTRSALAARLPSARDQALVTPGPGFTANREAAAPTRVVELQGELFGTPGVATARP
jgi:branched-chain amino acid transport system substrate-binding protein